MMNPLGDITASILLRFRDLYPTIVYRHALFVLVEVDLSNLYLRFNRPIILALTTLDALRSAITEKEAWLNNEFAKEVVGVELLLFVVEGAERRQADLRILECPAVRDLGAAVPMDELDPVGDARPPHEVLKAVLLKHCPIDRLSPYRIDTPTSPKMLFGRQGILDDIKNAQSDKTILTGPRRIGKTSLAKAVQLRAGTIPRPSEHFGSSSKPINRCAYVDVDELGDRASTDIWIKILEQFGLRYTDYSAGGRMAPFNRRDTTAVGDLVIGAKALLSFLLSQQNRGPLTIILDEVDSWIEQEAGNSWKVMNQLRGITDQGRAKVILVGYESLLFAAENHRFPFAGRGIRSISLGPIERTAVKDLVLKPTKELGLSVEREDEFFSLLWGATEGMPHLVQDICYHLVDMCLGRGGRRTRVGTNDLLAAIEVSDAVKSFRAAAANVTDFPLAQAIAGICSAVEAGGSDSGSTLTIAEIARRLEDASERVGSNSRYIYDQNEFRLALKYLELRFILRPLDEARSRWTWRNEAARRTMWRVINETGYERWLANLLRRHNNGLWRKRYESLLSG